MSTITKEWLESQISAIKAVGITDSNTLQAFEIALASLEAEPAIHRWRRVTFEPYGPYPWHYGNFIGFSKPVDGIEDEYYYAAPPAPVSVPAAMEMDDDFDSAFEHGKAVGWNAYRAAMLQSFGNSEQLNSPVIPDGWVACSEQMPEDEQEVIVQNKMGYRYVSYFDEHSGLFFDMRGGNQMNCIEHIFVTHWMPMPAAPQQEA